jgi:heptosyltransferase-2
MENFNIPNCKNFTGYKPCFPGSTCYMDGCKNENPFGTKILFINLDAMGDVIMSTSYMPAIKRKYPVSTIWWVTLKISAPLLENNQYIDKVLPYDFETISILQNMEFDVLMNVDKSMRSGALANMVKAKEKYGFGINNNGQIVPLNPSAEYNYRLGLDDNLKFKVNTVKRYQYNRQTFELDDICDEYVFNFTDDELKYIEEYKKKIGITSQDKIIMFNTGCSNLYPNKKMTIEQHIDLIERFLKYNKYKIGLAGGPEDTERNNYLKNYFGDKIFSTPTTDGVRRGACYLSLADVVITGDSFGMHLSIALKKYIIAWFGLSCWSEIELYGRGIKLYPEGLSCAPCWKKVCPFNLECIKMIDLDRIEKETVNYLGKLKK